MSEITKTRTWVKPVYIRKLDEKLGPKKTADEIGCVSTHVHRMLSDDRAVKCYELAARGVYERMFEKNAKIPTCAVIAGPDHAIETVRKIMEACGGKVQVVE